MPYFFPVTGKVMLHGDTAPRIAVANKYGSHFMAEHISIRTCQSGDGDRYIRLKKLPYAGCHQFRRLLRHRTVLFQYSLRHTEDSVFHIVTVADDTTFVDRAASRYGRQSRTDPATCQAFGRDQGLPF